MAWIDFRKAYNIVPYWWMIKPYWILWICWKKLWKTGKKNLICSSTDLGSVKINCGIFQSDSLSTLLFVVSLLPLRPVLHKMKQGYSFDKGKIKLNHLLFIDDLKLYDGSKPDIERFVQTVYNVTDDIGMRFRIGKCGVSVMGRGKESECKGITIGSG